jgi:hypothetical protein
MKLDRTDFAELSAAILGQGAALRFRADGRSMVPFIRTGDVLTVQPVAAADLKVGDVIFCRLAGDKLVAHRLTGRCQAAGRSYLVTRGDAAVGLAEQVQPNQVLGRVMTVQRGPRLFRLDRGRWWWLGLAWARLWPLRPFLWRLRIERVLKVM